MAEGVKTRFVQLPGGATPVSLKGSEIFCGNADAVLAQRVRSMGQGRPVPESKHNTMCWGSSWAFQPSIQPGCYFGTRVMGIEGD